MTLQYFLICGRLLLLVPFPLLSSLRWGEIESINFRKILVTELLFLITVLICTIVTLQSSVRSMTLRHGLRC